MATKLRYDIKGIDCAACAAKLEGLFRSCGRYQGATLNFTLGTLTVEAADGADEEQELSELQRVADGFEDGIEVSVREE
ncbi:MAG: hypothetical protein K6A65_00305 [Succinivibrionaceae bacterium]|nr:hypothetical protein [Succinivibrionaceae bacterium]